jgi:hypothetical protein
VFEDASGRPALAFEGTVRAGALLTRLRQEPTRPAIAVDAAQGLLLERLRQRLAGWEEQAAPGCAIFRLGPLHGA